MTTTSAPASKRRFGLIDAIIAVVLLAIVIVLAVTLMKQLSLRSEASQAKATTDKLITAMQKQDGTAARLLGDEDFRSKNSDVQLRALFVQSKPFTSGTPTVVKQTIDNGTYNKVVSIYYKFDSKQPFYVRVTALEPNDGKTWKIINFSGNRSLATLEK